MTLQKQTHNSNILVKMRMRENIPEAGAIWLPFCGFGTCSKSYDDSRIFGCDVDLDALGWWHEARRAAKIVGCAADWRALAGGQAFFEQRPDI